MPIGKYRVPRELKDEDRWFKYFTKRQLAMLIAAAAVDFLVIALFTKIHLVVVGIVLAILIFIFALAIIYLKMPRSRHTHGGGLGFDVLLMRIIKRKRARNKTIFTACFWYEEPERAVKKKGPADMLRERI